MTEPSFDLPVEKENTIEFYSEDTAFEFQNSKAVSLWIKEVIEYEKKELKSQSGIWLLPMHLFLHSLASVWRMIFVRRSFFFSPTTLGFHV